MFLTGLPRVLDDAGVPYSLTAGCQTRSLYRSGITDVRAVFWHTTESTDKTFARGANAPTLAYVTRGLSYPLYNLLVGRDGRVHVVAYGAAAHAGEGSIGGRPAIPRDQGNRYAFSISFDANNKGYPVTAAQLETAARLGAAIDREWRGTIRHIMHGEWSPGRRSDPTRIPGGWAGLRAAIKRGHWADRDLNVTAPDKPTPKPDTPTPAPKPKEWSEMASKQEVINAGYEGAKKARDEKNVEWTDSVTGKVTHVTEAVALGRLSVLAHREKQAELAAQKEV